MCLVDVASGLPVIAWRLDEKRMLLWKHLKDFLFNVMGNGKCHEVEWSDKSALCGIYGTGQATFGEPLPIYERWHPFLMPFYCRCRGKVRKLAENVEIMKRNVNLL